MICSACSFVCLVSVVQAIGPQTWSAEVSDQSPQSTAFASLLLSLGAMPNPRPMQRTVGTSMQYAEEEDPVEAAAWLEEVQKEADKSFSEYAKVESEKVSKIQAALDEEIKKEEEEKAAVAAAEAAAEAAKPPPFIIGTGGSDLALAMAHEAEIALQAAFPDVFKGLGGGSGEREIQIKRIKYPAGGKDAWNKVFDTALKSGEINICVKMMADSPMDLTEGIVMPCVMWRAAPNDVFISTEAASPFELPDGSVIGVTSARRKAHLQYMAKAKGKTLKFADMRGNTQARLMEVIEGSGPVKSTILSKSTIDRLEADGLNFQGMVRKTFLFREVLPGAGGGAMGISCKEGDEETVGFLTTLNNKNTQAAVDCERTFMKTLGATSKDPVGAFACVAADGNLGFKGRLFSSDYSECEEVQMTLPVESATILGEVAAKHMLHLVDGDIKKR